MADPTVNFTPRAADVIGQAVVKVLGEPTDTSRAVPPARLRGGNSVDVMLTAVYPDIPALFPYTYSGVQVFPSTATAGLMVTNRGSVAGAAFTSCLFSRGEYNAPATLNSVTNAGSVQWSHLPVDPGYTAGALVKVDIYYKPDGTVVGWFDAPVWMEGSCP